MAILVSDFKTAYTIYKRDISDVSNNLFLDWCDFLNKSLYRRLINIEPERFISTQSYTVSSSPSTQSLPTTFKNIQAIGAGFFYVDPDGNDTATTLTRTGFGRTDTGYYITGDNVVFTGIENETFKLRFIPVQTKIDDLTDYFTLDTATGGTVILDNEYLDYGIKAIDVLYDQWDEDSGAEGIADFRFVRVLNELLTTIRKESNVYAIDDASQNF